MKPVRPDSEAPGDEGQRAEAAGLGEREARDTPPVSSGFTTSVDVTNTTIAERDEDHGDRLELTLQVGHRAFLDRRRDLDHLGVPWSAARTPLIRNTPTASSEQRGHRREDQPEPGCPVRG